MSKDSLIPLSIVELATVAPGSTASEALVDSLQTARHAEAHGYQRVWFAEHHLAAGVASQSPEVMIAAAAASVTSEIRVGSGAVLLNHYSPLKVAEVFMSGTPVRRPHRSGSRPGATAGAGVVDFALSRERSGRFVDDHQEQVTEVLAWLLTTAFPTVTRLPSVR